MSEELQFHIKLSQADGARYAILPGDPGRVPRIAGYLDRPEPVAQNREYTSWKGYIEDEKVLVISSGIGGPSASICVEELANVGVDTIIRIGTCGGMAGNVNPGDVVIANAAIRMEGTSKEYLPIEFPAVADFYVTKALDQAAKNVGVPSHLGVVQCKDAFYGQHAPETMGCAEELKYKWQAWIRGGCLASEMESAALYTVAAVRRLRAGAVFHVVWNQEQAGIGMPQQRTEDVTKAIMTAVEAIRLLIEEDRRLGR